MAQAAQAADQQLQDTQNELQQTRGKLAAATAAHRNLFVSQVAELESEVGLIQARRDALYSMLDFVASSSNGSSAVGLRGQIEELARSVPASLSHPQGAAQGETTAEPSSAANNSVARKAQPTGIWGLAADLIRLSAKRRTLEEEAAATNDLGKSIGDFRKPTLDNLRGLIQQGDQLFAAADTATPAQLAQQRQQIDALTAQFKQTSSLLLCQFALLQNPIYGNGKTKLCFLVVRLSNAKIGKSVS